MGFRSVFVSEDNAIRWPEWFIEKYKSNVQFSPSKTGSFASPYEIKLYKEEMINLPQDIQKAINWDLRPHAQFIVVFLHECGGVTRLHVEKDSIRWSEPTTWDEVQEVSHHYCFDCGKVITGEH
jgi:hypothetical protein